MHDMPMATFDEEQKKRNARMSSVFKAAEKNSSSRLLREAGAQYNEKEIDKDKMNALSDLYYAMCNEIRQGEMEPKEAIKDFYDGAMAIFGSASKSEAGKSNMSEKRMATYS